MFFCLYGDPSLAIDPHVIVPVITPAAGEYYPSVAATVSLPGGGWTIHYTTDGSDPDSGDPIYTGPITFTEDGVLKVWAEKVGTSIYSAVSTAQYTITPDELIAPTIVPASGSYLLRAAVTGTFPKTGWTIHYITNGAEPTRSDPILGAGATITETCTFKARAFEDGGSGYSAVATKNYIILPLEIFVDDDAAGDPGPNDPLVSDFLEDGSAGHPFDAIQEAIDYALSGVTITVLPGTYTGTGNRNIDFSGKTIILRSIEPTNPQVVAATVIDAQGSGRCLIIDGGESSATRVQGLTITNGYTTSAGGGIYCISSSPVIENCRILNCRADAHGGGLFLDGGAVTLRNMRIQECNSTYGAAVYAKNYAAPLLERCLLVDNAAVGGGALCVIMSNVTFRQGTMANNTASSYGGAAYIMNGSLSCSNSILWGNTAPGGPGLYLTSVSSAALAYCDVQGGTESYYLSGSGNSYNWPAGCCDREPLFVDPANGDYHLQSTAGHWNEAADAWVTDAQTSPVIDMAHPSEGIGEEAADAANVRKNLGAYGGTAQASRTPEGWSLLCDVNNDGVTDLVEFGWLAAQWQQAGSGQDSDYNGDGSVTMADLLLLCGDWMGAAGWAL